LFRDAARPCPQVFRGEAYNAKADIFSLSVIIFQIFAQLNISSRFQSEIDAYNFAQRVANGHRPAFPQRFPPALCAMLEAGWSEDPAERPTAAQLLAKLKTFGASAEYAKLAGTGGGRGGGGNLCGCLG
jgi:Protein tyrosine and serine/threonine kinase